MTRPDAAVSFADLAAAGVRLRPLEIVTIVRELAAQVAAGEAPGMPSAHVIRLSPSGAISIEGPVVASGRPVARAAQLLDSLLPGFDAAPEFRAPGALRLVVARALGTLDLPAYATLETFSEALARFSAPEAAPIVRQLVANWAECVAAEQSPTEQPDVRTVEIATKGSTDDVRTESVLESFAMAAGSSHLSISDVRRARRATGLTLAQLSERSRIPVALLRELEWGYLPNWPVGHYGRTQLVRYARAAGLDEEVVVRAVWPLIEERTAAEPTFAKFADSPPHALALNDDLDLAPLTFEAPAIARIQPSRGTRILAALAIPALLAIAIAPAAWYQSTRRSRVEQVQPPVAATDARTDSAPSESEQPAPTQVASATQNLDDRAESVPDRLVPAVPQTAPAATSRTVSSVDEPAAAATSGEAPFSPTSSAVGSAAFYNAKPGDSEALTRPDGDNGAVLRITRIVDDTAKNFHVRPSPDGGRIAFDSDRDGQRAVYVADADGKHVRRVTGEGFAAIPSWSPDGQSLAFVRAEEGKPDVWNLWTTDLSTGSFRRLTKYSVGRPWGGSWFPDGKRIAYGYEDRLILLDTERGIERVYTSPRKGRLVRTPSVSPDGGRVVFQVSGDGAWLLELRDGSLRRILDDPSADQYAWAPDGSRVAYYSIRTGSWGVWVMAPR
jgi:Tol biopolymer transport system component/cytoskeletal protein RodZ